MKAQSRTQPLRYDTDPPSMREAIDWLLEQKIRFVRPTRYHLKIGRLNFYPQKGSINLDGEPRFSEEGLEGLQTLYGSRRDLFSSLARQDFETLPPLRLIGMPTRGSHR